MRENKSKHTKKVAEKILLCTIDIAGIISSQAKYLKQFHSVHTSHVNSKFEYGEADLKISSKNRIFELISRIYYGLKTIGKYDIYHYHYGTSFFTRKLWMFDAYINKKLGKKIIVQFHGSDIRDPSIELLNNKYYINSYSESKKRSQENIKIWTKLSNGKAIISDPTLYKYLKNSFKKIYFIPLSIDVKKYMREYACIEKNTPLIVHAPSNTSFKGTEWVRSIMTELKNKNYQFSYKEIQNLNHRDLLQEIKKADLIIDQLRGGSYGMLSIEAMAFGKPVFCYLSNDVKNYHSNFPIINVTKEDLLEKLIIYINNSNLRYQKGKESRSYIEKNHDININYSKLIDIYKTL